MARPFNAFLVLGVRDSKPPLPEILFSFIAPGYELPQCIIDYCFPEALIKSRKTEGQLTVFYPNKLKYNKQRGYVSKFMPPNTLEPSFPICFCFLTEIDWLSLFNQCSTTLQQIFISKKQFLYSENCSPTDLPKNCGKFLLPFITAMYKTPIPVPGKLYEIFSLPTKGINSDKIVEEMTLSLLQIQRPTINNFDRVQNEVDAEIKSLLHWINIEDIVSVIAWLYSENSILISSSSSPISSSLSISITQLLTPYNWEFLIYPVAPEFILRKYFDEWKLRMNENINFDNNQKMIEKQKDKEILIGESLNELDSIYLAHSPMDYLYSKYYSSQQVNENINNKNIIQPIIAGIIEENVGIIPKNFPHVFVNTSNLPVTISVISSKKESINKFIERIQQEKDSSPTFDFARFLIFRQYLSEKLVFMGKKQIISEQQKQIQTQQHQQQSKSQININSLSDLQQLFLEQPNLIIQYLHHINLSLISNYGEFCIKKEKDQMKSTDDEQIKEQYQLQKEMEMELYGGLNIHSFINSKSNKEISSDGNTISTAQFATALITRGKQTLNNITEINQKQYNNQTFQFSDNFCASMFRSFIYSRAQLRSTGLQGFQIQIDEFDTQLQKLNQQQEEEGNNMNIKANAEYKGNMKINLGENQNQIYSQPQQQSQYHPQPKIQINIKPTQKSPFSLSSTSISVDITSIKPTINFAQHQMQINEADKIIEDNKDEEIIGKSINNNLNSINTILSSTQQIQEDQFTIIEQDQSSKQQTILKFSDQKDIENRISAIIICTNESSMMKSIKSKFLHKIGGCEIINHVKRTLETLGTKQCIVVISQDIEMEIRSCLNENEKIVVQNDQMKIINAIQVGLYDIENMDEIILITYGDIPLISEETYKRMICAINNNKNSLILIGFQTNNVNNGHDRLIIDSENIIKFIIKYKNASDKQKENTLCSTGIFALRSSRLLQNLLKLVQHNNQDNQFCFSDIIELAINQNHVCACITVVENEVMKVNSIADLSIVEHSYQTAKREEFLSKGVNLIDPDTVYFSYGTEIENDVTIEQNVIFMNNVKLHSGAEIKAFTYLEDCEVFGGAIIGPFARIRPESVIGQNSRVGNFCEIKKSYLGNGTKVSHLSYIGDSDIGEQTNIGAGTITCNYDGYSKFNTKIGSNSFVGSNTIFIAPVSIGDNTLTAAGSVITKDVDSNSLAITRSEQKNIQNGMIKYRSKRNK